MIIIGALLTLATGERRREERGREREGGEGSKGKERGDMEEGRAGGREGKDG